MRLIDADAVLERLDKVITRSDSFGMGVRFGVNHAEDVIKKAPIISPDSLRPKGRWEQIGYDDVLDRITCSHCKEYWNILDNDTETFNFCPNCGADMREE